MPAIAQEINLSRQLVTHLTHLQHILRSSGRPMPVPCSPLVHTGLRCCSLMPRACDAREHTCCMDNSMPDVQKFGLGLVHKAEGY